MVWDIVSREYHNSRFDLITVHVPYTRCIAVNQYLILKDEKRVPRELLEERKYGPTRNLDGSEWVEGTIRRGRRK